MEQSSLVASTSIIVMLLAASRVMGFIREQAFASVFGASSVTDAYVMAQFITVFTFTAASAVVGSAFLPVYAAMRARGEQQEAARFVRSVFVLTLGACAIVSALGMAFAPALVRLFAPGFEADTRQLASGLTAILFPAMAIATLTTLTSASLNAHGIFGLPAASPLLQNALVIAAILLLAGRFSIWGVAAGTVVGALAGLAIHLPALRRTQISAERALDFTADAVRTMLRLSWPILLTSVIGQVSAIVEKVLASGLDEGSLASLNYASKISTLPVTVIAGAICTVMFPRLSELHGTGDREGISHALARSSVAVMAILMPAAVAFGSLSSPIVRVVYQRGAFGEVAVQTTATILVFYAWAVTFQALSMLFTRAFYAMHNSAVPLVVTGVGTVVTVVADVILVESLGAGGLALGPAISAVVGSAALLILLTTRHNIELLSRMISPFLKIVAACVVMRMVSVWMISRLPVTDGGLLSAVRFFVTACTGAGVYGLCIVLLGVLPMADLLALGRRVVARSRE